jgi:hypothetical protein
MTSKAIYEIGPNKHGQQVRIEIQQGGGYTLVQEAANQRDETQRISLTREQVVKIGRAADIEVGAL